tara:strand:- start:81 stop:254 length:174 start_codon:yes stop_codon:yes gene_type:complete
MSKSISCFGEPVLLGFNPFVPPTPPGDEYADEDTVVPFGPMSALVTGSLSQENFDII